MKRRSWFWGIFLVVAAVLIIAGQFVSFAQIGLWSIIGAVAVGALLVSSIVKLSFGGILFSLALEYIIFQKPLGLFYISPWILILAAVLGGVGLDMIFRRGARRKGHGANLSHTSAYTDSEENGDDNHPYASVSFGALSKYLHADCVESGEFRSSFAAMEVFFDQVTLAPGGAEIRLDCSFGAIKLYVPKNWRVIDNVGRSLGGVENDTRFAAVTDSSPQLVLTGDVSLGGVEVQYV